MKHRILISGIVAAFGLTIFGCQLSTYDLDNPLDPEVDAPIEDVLPFVVDGDIAQAIRDTEVQFKSEVTEVRVFLQDVESLEGIQFFPAIRYLELNNVNLVSLGTDLSPILELENLNGLNLMANGYTDENVSSLPPFPGLSFFSLGFNDITDAASVVPIVERYGRAELELDIQEMPIDADTLASLRPVLDRLSGLSIGNFNAPSSNPITDLGFLTTNDTIRRVELGGLSITDYEPLAQLSALQYVGIHAWPDTNLDRLTFLSGTIEELNVSESSLTSLAGLPGGLSQLALEGSSALTDISELAAAGANAALRELNISRTPLDEGDMAVLSSLQRLDTLFIFSVPAITTLDFLAGNPNLQRIHAGNNPDLVAGLDSLVSLPELEELWITASGFSPADVDAFRAARPDVIVDYP
ncbi:MAG: hypothetical protein MI724_19005 [Spirochaetales bacterium]|nr:hypothetical protein [Spirochaetales bacterium]